jgi:hypothetical protein
MVLVGRSTCLLDMKMLLVWYLCCLLRRRRAIVLESLINEHEYNLCGSLEALYTPFRRKEGFAKR